ncbi:MAG: hypothetical protein LKJ21_03220 [Oscillospiraceae bacterium]|jgi:hypothetical protein|nr:hypothetical protein [Oscillospiraceae bacterium]MCI1990004.1 hypothetical protein [Oscillospiraceae bacterium]MCI2034824.1 hypothetical protein [Oscillospiraceae bacterium]
MKKLFAIVLSCAAILLAGCSSPAASGSSNASSSSPSSNSAPLDLTGEWKQTNSDSSTSYQTATISGNTIEVNWIDDSEKSKSLYWAGTYAAPKNASDTYSWTSKNDKSKTGGAMLASSDGTKTFTYKKGILSYSVSALGTTKTVELKRQ